MQVPYGDASDSVIINSVTAGKRLKLPPDLSPQLSALISSCWEAVPKKRPSMRQVEEALEKMFPEATRSAAAPAVTDSKLLNEILKYCFLGARG